jgi:hypothetical protein
LEELAVLRSRKGPRLRLLEKAQQERMFYGPAVSEKHFGNLRVEGLFKGLETSAKIRNTTISHKAHAIKHI